MSKPTLYTGSVVRDKRGSVRFVNDFKFKNVKRFYEVTHKSIAPRAFHGHLKEAKYIYVTSGSALICAVKLNNIKNPNKNAAIYKFILNSETPQVLHIPPGYANGFMPLEKNTKVIFFSTSTLSNSLKDDFRFPSDYWGKDVWK